MELTHNVYFSLDDGFPDVLEVGAGNAQFVSGWCFHVNHETKTVAVSVGEKAHDVQYTGECRQDVATAYAKLETGRTGVQLTSGFRGIIPIAEDLVGKRLPVRVVIGFSDGSTATYNAGSTEFVRLKGMPTIEWLNLEKKENLVAICMATCNPDPQRFQRQIDSIRRQSHTNWICIVSDDASDADHLKMIRQVCGMDERFFVFENSRRAGAYLNFERCLRKVPRSSMFIAFADQDDYWYPGKLERCIAAFDRDTSLVYSDMRVVSERGSVISPTFWQGRRNNFTDLDIQLLTNSITGAATVFRTNLLDRVLPFPQHPAAACLHDYWVACVALLSGDIVYIEEPLYDYVQHSENTIGFKRGSEFLRRIQWGNWRAGIKEKLTDLTRLYRSTYTMLGIVITALRLRFPEARREHQKMLAMLPKGEHTIGQLFRLHLKIRYGGYRDNGLALALAQAHGTSAVLRFYYRVIRHKIFARITSLQ